VISVTVALVLALLCVALLIYFIAHVVNLIQSSTIVESAHEDTMEAIARLDDLEDAPPEDPDGAWDRPELAELLAADPLVVRAGQSGYVQYLEVGKIVERVMRGCQGRRADDRRRGAVRVWHLRRRGTSPGEGLARASIAPGG
jgi:uncharacterized membrane protein